MASLRTLKETLAPTPLVAYLLQAGILFIVYFLTARLGHSLFPVNTFAASIWLSSGIALATLYLCGLRLWPAVFLAGVAAYLIQGAPFLAALGIGTGIVFENIFAVALLRKVFAFDPSLARARDAVSFVVTAVLASALNATIGVGSLTLSTALAAGQFSATWFAWWIADALGIIILTPLFIRWVARPFSERSMLEYLEIVSALLIVTLISYVVFWSPFTHFGIVPLFYLLFPPLMWVALRTGPRLMTLSNAIVAGAALTGVLFGKNPSFMSATAEGVLSLQLILGAVAALFLTFTSLEESRKETDKQLGVHVGKLEEALEKIRASDYAKTQFLAILAHELRNPLAPIISGLELLKKKVHLTLSAHEYVRMVEKNLRSLTHLLDDLLDISRISRRKFTLEKERVDLRGVLARSVQSTESFIKSRRHTLSIFTPSYPISVTADPVRLEQVVVNLLNNAAKYTPPNGRISLSCFVESGTKSASIKVTDTGVGIPKESLERIFEPFVQLRSPEDVETRKEAGGLGIGLSLVKRLVELHGGTISVTSDGEGKGSEFSVEIPLSSAEEGEGTRAEPKEAAAALQETPLIFGGKQRVIVVDDNVDAARGLAILLADEGHDVRVAHSAEGALTLAEEFSPTAAILDVGLPGMSGYVLGKTLRQNIPSPLLLIALSGYGQPEDKEEAAAAGFDLHLTKPVSIRDLLSALDGKARKY